VLKIKSRPVRVWVIPAFESMDIEIDPPKFETKEAVF
jgi:hypothetical protein